MRTFLAVLLTAMLGLGAGCEKRGAPPVEPAKYKQSTDGPPSWTAYRADPNITRDQAEVARQTVIPVTGTPATAATTGPAPATGPAEAPPATSPGAAATATAPADSF